MFSLFCPCPMASNMLTIMNYIKGFLCLLTSFLKQIREITSLSLEGGGRMKLNTIPPSPFSPCLPCSSIKSHGLSQTALTMELSFLVPSKCFFHLSLHSALSTAFSSSQQWSLEVLVFLDDFHEPYHITYLAKIKF